MRYIKIIFIIILYTTNSFTATNDKVNKWLVPPKTPAPKDNKTTKDRIDLGKILFFDKRLSKTQNVSCATCHNPNKGWSDGKPIAIGVNGKHGTRNSPTIINTGFQNRQFWDGRVKTLEEQALGPMQAKVEMGMKLEDILKVVKSKKDYVRLFAKAYPNEKLTIKTISKAISSFERTIISAQSPFDKYIQGDKDALSDIQKKGFEIFKNKGSCMKCHDGFNFTDGSFHNIGLGDKDIGRLILKKSRKVWTGAMKTPTLRDIEKTAPYFHNGSVDSLKEAVRLCAIGGKYPNLKYKSPDIKDRHLTKKELNYITMFLKSLSSKDIKIDIPKKFPN